MLSAWTIGINLIARSNAGRVFGMMGAEAQAANKQVHVLQKGINSTTNGISKIPGAAKAARYALDGLAIGAAVTMAIGIKGAANLQDAYAQTGVAMGRTSEWVKENFQDTAMAMSQSTAQSVTQSMSLLRVMATSGINDPAQMKALAMPIAQFADTQYLGKNHVAFDESAALAVKIAHQFGARTAKELKPILNSLFKISQDMPDSLKTAGTQLKYYAAKYTERGVSANEVLMLQATLDRLGYGGGKSGTGMYQIYRNLLSPNKKQSIAQDQLKLSGKDIISGDGTFHVENLLNKLNAQYEAARISRDPNAVKSYDQKLNLAFTSNAALIAGVLASHTGRAQYKNVGQTMNRVEDLQKAQVQLMGTLNNKTKLLATNFQSLATMLGQPFIVSLTGLVSKTANLIGDLASYFNQHPRQAQVAGGGALALGAYGLWRIAALARLALHTFSHHLGVSVMEGGHEFQKDAQKFEASMIKALRNGIVNIGQNASTTLWSKFVLPVLTQVNKLGPIGSTITSWVLRIGSSMGTLGGFLGTLGSILGKLAGAPLTALMMVLNPGTISDQHSKDGGIGETPADLARVRGIDAQRRASYLRQHSPTASAPRHQPGHGQQAMIINHHFHAGAGTSDATNRLHAIAQGREVAKQVAAVMSQYGRTATRAAGQTIASARMSSFETTSSYS